MNSAPPGSASRTRSYQAFRPCVDACCSGKKNGRVRYCVDLADKPARMSRTVTIPKIPREPKIGRFRGLRICCAPVVLLHPACQSLKPRFLKSPKPGSPDHTLQTIVGRSSELTGKRTSPLRTEDLYRRELYIGPMRYSLMNQNANQADLVSN